MDIEKFETGMIIKGSDLKGYTLCKVLSEDMRMRGFQYQIGMNEDVNPLARWGYYKTGLHFTSLQNVMEFICNGTQLAIVKVPDDEDVYVGDRQFRTHRLVIEKVMHLKEPSTWEYLYGNGIDVITEENRAVVYAAKNGYLEAVKYLHEQGTDITMDNNIAVVYAAKRGYVEVVKYLHQNGADITANDNYAMELALENNNIEVIEYLKTHMK